MRDIGDGDPEDVPVGVLGVVVGFGKAGVVVVARVRRVDGDERDLAQILAAGEACGLLAVGLLDHVVGEVVGDAVLVDRDERDGLGRRRIAEARHDPRAGQTHAGFRAALFGLDQFAVLRTRGGAGRHRPFAVGTLVDGHDAPALGPLAENAQHAARVGADLADKPRLVVMFAPLDAGEPAEDTIAFTQGGIGGAGDKKNGGLGPLAAPFQRLRGQVAVRVGGVDLKDRNGRQAFGIAVGLLAFL